MNKFKFKVRNILLASKFYATYPMGKIEYPSIMQYLDNKYGTAVFKEDFSSLDNWDIKDAVQWGSAVPDNLCTYVKENILLKQQTGKNSLVIMTTPVPATGKDWEGKEVTKPISSGMVLSKFLVRPGQLISATVNNSGSYAGSWFAFWLSRKDVPGDERYREVDIFEKFMDRKAHKQYTMTIHGGTQETREMLNFSYPMFMVDEGKLTFSCELTEHKVRIFVNGIQVFLAEEPDFNGEYHVIFDDAPTNHGGKVKTEDIINNLPKSFEVLDFRVYNL